MINASFEYAKDEIDRRLRNPFWGSFILSWVGWNWKVWYVTIFVDDKLVGNKIDYIGNMYTYFNFYHLFPFVGFILNWIIAPCLIGFLVIWHLPKITNEFLRKQQLNKIDEDGILSKELDSTKKILKKKEALANQALQTIKKEGAVKKIEEQENNIWDEEYKNLDLNILEKLSIFIYEDKGRVGYDVRGNMRIPAKTLSQLDAYGLVNAIDQGIYEITEKGKYFLKRLSMEIK